MLHKTLILVCFPLTFPALSPAEETIPVFLDLIDQVRVPAREAGMLTKVLVREGAVVKKGQTLAAIDAAEARFRRNVLRLQVEAAREESENDAPLQAAQKGAEVAKHDWERTQRVRRKNPDAASAADEEHRKLTYEEKALTVEQAALQMRLAKIKRRQKEAELEFADEKLARFQIRSPIDGVVAQVAKPAGEWIEPAAAPSARGTPLPPGPTNRRYGRPPWS